VYLKALGHPTLRDADGTMVGGLRKKDLALLVYLCVEDSPVHARARLAALLWGESPKERARHSLTQALGRLGRVLPRGVLAADKDVVRWSRGLACDATALLRGEVGPEEVDDGFSLYAGPFLEGFHPGANAGEFEAWADRRRAELRNAALLLLECAGQDAVAARDWSRALQLAEREVQIDPVWEQGHRRLMRAMAARGERNLALRHYQAFGEWLARDVGGKPDPETHALAEHLRGLDALPESADPPPVDAAAAAARPAALPTGRPPAPAREPEAAPGPPCDAPAVPTPEQRGRRWTRSAVVGAGVVLVVVVLVGLWILAVAEPRTRKEPPPGHGEDKAAPMSAGELRYYRESGTLHPSTAGCDAG
jgi:DNA-binding SARP family transcriptional activator